MCYTVPMISQKEKINGRQLIKAGTDPIPRDALFFDIETTGLGWRSSHLYLIGVLFREGTDWILQQWFLDRPFAEKEMLELFSDFLDRHRTKILIHYNGDTFDLPFLRNKYVYYDLPVPQILQVQETPDTGTACTFPDFLPGSSLDLLKIFRPLRKRLPVSSLRQQELERFLQTGRKDAASGKELIAVYQDYLQTGDTTLLDALFLHNREDVLGLSALWPVFSYIRFWNGEYRVLERTMTDQKLMCTLSTDISFPVSFTLRDNAGRQVSFLENRILLTFPVVSEERKLFFPDFRNYYYLPAEDQAIHKSVGMFVDPACRRQASRETCYQRIQADFLPVPASAVPDGISCFLESCKDKTAWLRADDVLSMNQEECRLLLHRCLTAAF
ncbi:MAG: ribonuclease H-like domain-containing protein [Eubacterium sp.]|nr:ribonuclease H-like domain-containing protein [Eubacterium sp.]